MAQDAVYAGADEICQESMLEDDWPEDEGKRAPGRDGRFGRWFVGIVTDTKGQ